jgi:hypothetical protein
MNKLKQYEDYFLGGNIRTEKFRMLRLAHFEVQHSPVDILRFEIHFFTFRCRIVRRSNPEHVHW